MEGLVYGVFKPEAVAGFQRIIGRMRDAGCDAVVLGCTEIPLRIDDTNSQLPTDRKSVVTGKSVSVRVDLGGAGIIQKKISKTYILLRTNTALAIQQYAQFIK